MTIGTKTVNIGENEITIIQFGAIEALGLRKQLAESVKMQLGNVSAEPVDMIKAIAGLVYEIPVDLLMKLFKNCSAIDIGALNTKENFEKVFNNNLDGVIELALEVLDFNGFFTLNIISILAKKIPMLVPMESAIKETLNNMKKDATMTLKKS
jgi:hypothetical protein